MEGAVVGTGVGVAVGVGVGVGVAVDPTVGNTVACRPSVPEVLGREALLKDVGVVPVFVARDPPQPQSRTITAKKTRRLAFFLFLFFIALSITKNSCKPQEIGNRRDFLAIPKEALCQAWVSNFRVRLRITRGGYCYPLKILT